MSIFRYKMREKEINSLQCVSKKIQIKTKRKILGVVRENYLRSVNQTLDLMYINDIWEVWHNMQATAPVTHDSC